MTGTRKSHVPMAEQIRLINECSQSGMTEADWCRENDISEQHTASQMKKPRILTIHIRLKPL